MITEAWEHIFSSEASSETSATITSIPSIPDSVEGRRRVGREREIEGGREGEFGTYAAN